MVSDVPFLCGGEDVMNTANTTAATIEIENAGFLLFHSLFHSEKQ